MTVETGHADCEQAHTNLDRYEHKASSLRLCGARVAVDARSAPFIHARVWIAQR